MLTRIALACLVALCLATGPAGSQNAASQEDVRQGHDLAVKICSYCHVAALDQADEPILQPPAPSFESIAQRKTLDSAQTFLTTTHRDISYPKGMPNPQLLDYQVKQVAAYLLSLRK